LEPLIDPPRPDDDHHHRGTLEPSADNIDEIEPERQRVDVLEDLSLAEVADQALADASGMTGRVCPAVRNEDLLRWSSDARHFQHGLAGMDILANISRPHDLAWPGRAESQDVWPDSYVEDRFSLAHVVPWHPMHL
jgi:hypothetical protein